MTTARKIRRERITWVRWDAKTLQQRISHPWQWVYTDPDGYERFFDTKTEAKRYADKYEEAT